MAPGVASLKCRTISVPGLAAVLKFVALHHDLEHVGFHRGLFLPRRITRHTPRARIGAKKTKPQTNCERRKEPANLDGIRSDPASGKERQALPEVNSNPCKKGNRRTLPQSVCESNP